MNRVSTWRTSGLAACIPHIRPSDAPKPDCERCVGAAAGRRQGRFLADPRDASPDPWGVSAIPWGVSTIPWDVSDRPKACFERWMRMFAAPIAISAAQNAMKRRGAPCRGGASAWKKLGRPLCFGRAGLSQFLGKWSPSRPRARRSGVPLPRPLCRPVAPRCRFFTRAGPIYRWKMPNFASS